MDAVLTSSKSAEWLTPPDMIDLVKQVFGGAIDLDPCAPVEFRGWTGAKIALTQREDGLKSRWFGRVYMNPPYGTAISQWTGKLLAEYQEGRVREAIALVPARVDTKWYQSHLAMFPVCFLAGRLRFLDASRPEPEARDAAAFPSAVVYLGPDQFHFAETFKTQGRIFFPY